KTEKKVNSLKKALGYFYALAKSRYNYGGFKYVDGLTVLNDNFLGIASVKKQLYVPNSMRTRLVEFTWNKPYIIWVANIKARKRPEICIEVAESVKDLGIDLLMVGHIQDHYYDYLKQPENTPDNLHYIGPKSVEEVNGIIRESMFLIHTCRPEGFGNNFIQAWFQAKPVVSLEFDPGGLIKKHKLGYVSNDDVVQFIDDIKLLVSDKELTLEFGKNASEYSFENHDPKINVKILETFINKIVCEYNTVNERFMFANNTTGKQE
ncbi:MAG: glycosyltransferase, partial [Flavobacteriaceae bacterium]|nr:glycosyltransferase [Flavobacteriaceae bacterium]